MAKGMAEWQNGRKWIHKDTYVLFTVHADNDTDEDGEDDNDDDDNDTLIFYSIDTLLLYIPLLALTDGQNY